jgi:site-specific recombinase XerD
MNSTFNLHFFLRKNKPQEDASVPVYLRITIDGMRVDISTKRYILESKWKPKEQKASGTSEEAKLFNRFLKSFEQEVYEAYRKLLESGNHITAELLKNQVLGVTEKPRMLIEIFKSHNDAVKSLIGNGYAIRTWYRYNSTLKHIQEFLQYQYKLSDIDIKKLNYEFIADLEFYLRSQKKIDTNTNTKYIRNIKKIVNECVAKNWLVKDPFLGYKLKIIQVEREYLSELELAAIQDKIFSIERLVLVRDLFVFSCYTGLAYIDVVNLTKNNISVGIDGEKWVFTHRQKTETASRIPLLSIPLGIIEKYQNHPVCINKGTLLPMLSNQKMNAYLKEIADVCNIHKQLTFHIARHTFATTVTLSNGIPIESVSKMLGHKRIQTTQHYAKILDKKVSNDMQILRTKYSNELKFVKAKTNKESGNSLL